jgi:hypothetical protein
MTTKRTSAALRLVPTSDRPRAHRQTAAQQIAQLRGDLTALRSELTTRPSAPAGVVEQVRLACRPEHRLATACGFALGGFVPVATFLVSHYEYDRATPWYTQLVTLLIVGGLLYSARTVYDWAKLAFQLPAKALGFVVLLEGVMTLSSNGWLACAALAYLVAINGIATGVRLAVRV